MENDIPVSSALSDYISYGKTNKNPATIYLIFKKMEKQLTLWFSKNENTNILMNKNSTSFYSALNCKFKIIKHLDKLKHDDLLKCYDLFNDIETLEFVEFMLSSINKKYKK